MGGWGASHFVCGFTEQHGRSAGGPEQEKDVWPQISFWQISRCFSESKNHCLVYINENAKKKPVFFVFVCGCQFEPFQILKIC